MLTNITLQLENKDLQFQAKEGVQKAAVNIFGRITTMTRRVVQTFEDTVEVPCPRKCCRPTRSESSIYQKSIPLAPGTYRLNVVAKDVVGGNMNNYEIALNVPHLDPEKLMSSTIVLADVMEKVPTRSIGAGQFVIGTTKVRPARERKFQARREDGHLYQAVQLRPGREDPEAQRPDRV